MQGYWEMHNMLMSVDFDLPGPGSGYHATVHCSRMLPWEITVALT